MAPVKIKLSEFLQTLDFPSVKKSSEYVGTKLDNPAMLLEEGVPVWTKMADMDDIRESFRIFQERVCIQGFPARYSPQFWLAHAALTTIYEVLCGHLQSHLDPDIQMESRELLFHLWVELITAGPGSTHLEMMDVIMKNNSYPLWKYMETLTGEDLHILVSTLKKDFVYEEEVPVDHYATLMETHIDKIFRSLLSSQQYVEAQRELLDLQLYYLTRMNHVPPHIGPRLSHLSFLICNRYKMENPYLGMDDWVLMRQHLHVIKNVITHPTFTVASEAQYRAPITLEKIFQAAVIDEMLEIMFKDFMTLLLTFCNYPNSKKCKRLFLAYKTGLFEHLDFKKGFESCPYWLFDQCIKTVTQLAGVNGMQPHIEQFIVTVENQCLLVFDNLSAGQISEWHDLLVNYVVSGRRLLVCEARKLLHSSLLAANKVFDWKNKVKEARMLVDIISDLPKTFIQNDEDSSLTDTIQAYSDFLQTLLIQIKEAGQEGKVRDNVHRCVIKCTEKEPPAKAQITLACLHSDIPDFQDLSFIKELLFSVEKLLKDTDCPESDEKLAEAVEKMLTACLKFFRNKGYIAVDFNSLLMSICVICLSSDNYQDEGGGDHVTGSHDMYTRLYQSVVVPFVGLHSEKGTIRSISTVVPQVVLVVQEAIGQGTGFSNAIAFLQMLGNSCIQIISDHVNIILELFINWECFQLDGLLLQVYPGEPDPFVSRFQHMFDRLPDIDVDHRHNVTQLLSAMSHNQTQLFYASHISQLLTMYPDEREDTQADILDIIVNVAERTPALVVPHYSILTDDTKFSPMSLRGRAPILASISQDNGDFAKKTVDYLMKHISDTDSTVSLAAMETLVPLVKDNPGYVHKQKTKFRSLWRSSDCTRVKELCVTLLPDIQHLARGVKQVAKEAQPVNKNPKKVLAPVAKSAAPKITKQASVKPVSNSKQAKPKNIAPLKTVDTEKNKGQGDEGFEKEKFTVTTADTSYISVLNVCQDKSGNIPLKQVDKHKYGLDESKAKLNIDASEGAFEQLLLVITNETEDGNDRKGGDNIDADRNDEHVNDNDCNKKWDDPKKENDQENCTNQKNEEKISGTKQAEVLKAVESITSSTYAVTRPPVYLYGSDGQRLQKLGDNLREAGYETYMADQDTEPDSNDVENAKVAIFCFSANTGGPNQKTANEITSSIEKKIPMIFLKLQSMSWPPIGPLHSALTDRPFIRFYMKPGERQQLRGAWPQHKFQELLMQLSYYGVLPDNRLVTSEFDNWWKPLESSSTQSEAGTQEQSTVTSSAAPHVFISYHWGKQIQVEPLYHYLTRLGFHCWMGAHQMGGSESLYNKISQGLQGCRVVIACVTSVYAQSENCQQEVTIAQRLNRPIISLLLGNTRWPLSGEVGQKLMKYEYVKPTFSAGGTLDTQSDEMKKLLNKLEQYVPDIINGKQSNEKLIFKKEEADVNSGKCNTVEVQGDAIETYTVKQADLNIETNKTNKVYVETRSVRPRGVLAKSTSMYELENKSEEHESRFGYCKTDDDLGKRRKSEGVVVDEMGYTVKSARSKSCAIL